MGKTFLLFLSMCVSLVFAEKPEWERRPIEIIKGHLPKPHYPVFWNAADNGVDSWEVEGECQVGLSSDYCLWNDQSVKVTFNTAPGRVVFKPAGLVLKERADAIEIWVYGFKSGKARTQFEIQDANGKSFILKSKGNSSYWAGQSWWGATVARIPEEAAFPVKLARITFEASDKIKAGDSMYFDFLSAVTLKHTPLPDTSKWDEPFPFKKESILPTPGDKNAHNHVQERNGAYCFGFQGSDGSLLYTYTPRTGTLNDLSVLVDGKHEFRPMAEGGAVAMVGEKTISPTDTGVKANLLGCRWEEGMLKADWRLEKEGLSVEFTLGFMAKGRSLVIDCTSERGDFCAFDCGHTDGTPNPRLFSLTYLNYRWDYPRLLVTDDYFVSLFPDWYTSQASEVVDGMTSGGLEGSKVLGDHAARILGGSLYLANAANQRNPLKERFFLTIAPTLESVLPNIPNPQAKYYGETGSLIYSTRAYDSLAPGDGAREVDFWKLMADYGLKEIFVRFHANQWSTPLRSNHFTHYEYAYEAVGDANYQTIASGLKQILRRVGPYEDNRVSHALGPEFTYDDMAISRDGSFVEGYDTSFQPSPAAQHRLEAEYAPRLVAKYGWNACYMDEVTNTPPWGMVDYNPDIPGTGTYLNVLRNYGFVARKLSDYYHGPVWSEGNAGFLWAGYLDTDYAQTNEPDALPIVDFKLRKINPLEHFNGYDLPRLTKPLNYLLSAQIVNGNMGHLWCGDTSFLYSGNRLLEKATPEQIRRVCRSYFMMLQLQELYAYSLPEEISYQCGGELITATEMLRKNKRHEGKIHIRYDNELEVWVNRSPEARWTVEVDGATMVLPPYGFAAFMPGKLLEYSAEFNGRQVDYSKGPRYTYVDGNGSRTAFPEITCSNAYVIFNKDDMQTLTPVPFIDEESVSILGLTRMTPLDRAGKELAPEVELDVADAGKARFNTRKDAFRYRLK